MSQNKKTTKREKNNAKKGKISSTNRELSSRPNAMPEMNDLKKMFDNTNILSLNTGDASYHETGLRNINPAIWVDKYRPKTLDDVIGHDDIKNVITEASKSGDIPHLLFYGPPGTGKTSLAHTAVSLFYNGDCHSIKSNVLELNASDENGINVVREKIIRFANLEASRRGCDDQNNCPYYKIIILDEADSMTNEAQTALKKAMEKTCKITRFIIICNYENKIIDAIKSRCAGFRFNAISSDNMIKKLKIIAKNEGMVAETENVYNMITNVCDGDARRSINTMQNLKYIPRNNNSKIANIASYTKGMPEELRNSLLDEYELCEDNERKKAGLINITENDIIVITSSIDYTYFDRYWNQIKACPSMKDIGNIAHIIVNEGYPMNYVLDYFKFKVLKSNLNDNAKSDILLFIGSVERMLIVGSGNLIQTMAILTLIVSKYKEVDIRVPNIF